MFLRYYVQLNIAMMKLPANDATEMKRRKPPNYLPIDDPTGSNCNHHLIVQSAKRFILHLFWNASNSRNYFVSQFTEINKRTLFMFFPHQQKIVTLISVLRNFLKAIFNHAYRIHMNQPSYLCIPSTTFDVQQHVRPFVAT